MTKEYEELYDIVRALLLTFVGKVNCACFTMHDSCPECDQRILLEELVTRYIAHKRGRGSVQCALAKENHKRFDNLRMIEFSEFLDDLADVYPRLDKSTTI